MNKMASEGRYVDFQQDEINTDGSVEEDPMIVIERGGRAGRNVTEEEFEAFEAVVRTKDEKMIAKASGIVVPRLVSELQVVRTKIADAGI